MTHDEYDDSWLDELEEQEGQDDDSNNDHRDLEEEKKKKLHHLRELARIKKRDIEELEKSGISREELVELGVQPQQLKHQKERSAKHHKEIEKKQKKALKGAKDVAVYASHIKIKPGNQPGSFDDKEFKKESSKKQKKKAKLMKKYDVSPSELGNLSPDAPSHGGGRGKGQGPGVGW